VSSWILKQTLNQYPSVCKPGHNVLHDFHDRLHRHPPAAGHQIFQQRADLSPVKIAATDYPQVSQITQIALSPAMQAERAPYLLLDTVGMGGQRVDENENSNIEARISKQMENFE